MPGTLPRTRVIGPAELMSRASVASLMTWEFEAGSKMTQSCVSKAEARAITTVVEYEAQRGGASSSSSNPLLTLVSCTDLVCPLPVPLPSLPVLSRSFGGSRFFLLSATAFFWHAAQR